MPTKIDIIENVAEYTASELADFIRAGVVTFEELCGESDFSSEARKEVKKLIESSEEEDWQNAQAIDTIEEYDRYLKQYPEGNYRDDARAAKKRLTKASAGNQIEQEWKNLDMQNASALRSFISTHKDSPYAKKAQERLSQISRQRYAASAISRLKKEIEPENNPKVIADIVQRYVDSDEISVNQLYNEIQNDRNLFASDAIEEMEIRGLIDFQEIEERTGIDARFFGYITNNDLTTSTLSVNCSPITSIQPKTTEIYFWGIPASGKTCALGGILAEAQHGQYVEYAAPNEKSQGYHYMTLLSQIFEGREEVFKLPPGTATDEIFEMSYVLKRKKMDYPVTFIDLPGETIESMYLMNAKEPISNEKKEALQRAKNLLIGNAKINRKIHFFVLEYNGHQKMYKGLTQYNLLNGALSYIKQTGIFKTETDAIYLLITKSDLTGTNSEEGRQKKLEAYIRSHYKPFYNGLRSLCEEFEINGREVEIIPFSLGEVCFKNLCLFDNSTAAKVVELIVDRAKGFKRGWLGKTINVLNR